MVHKTFELSDIQEVEDIEDLTPEQFYILMSLIDRAMVQLETAYLLHEGGNMDDEVFNSRVRAFNSATATFYQWHYIRVARGNKHQNMISGLVPFLFTT